MEITWAKDKGKLNWAMHVAKNLRKENDEATIKDIYRRMGGVIIEKNDEVKPDNQDSPMGVEKRKRGRPRQN